MNDSRNRRVLVGLGLGLLVAGMSLGIHTIERGSSNPVVDGACTILTVVMLPGLIGSAAAGSLVAVAIINFIIYFGIGWLICAFFTRAGKTDNREHTGKPRA